MKRGKFESNYQRQDPLLDMKNSEDAISGEEVASGEKKQLSSEKSTLLYLHDLVYLMAVLLILFLVLFRVVVVSGESMCKTLVDGDYLLLLGNVFYTEPKQGDIIVASKDSFKNGEPIIKRVIATAGQQVDIDFSAGIVYVDDVPLDEPYVNTPTTLEEGMHFPLTVEDGCVFVMGDNRNKSKDSRNPEIGLVDRREILGKAIFLFLPGTNDGQEARNFERVGVLS